MRGNLILNSFECQEFYRASLSRGAHLGPFTFHQNPAENFAGSRFRNLIDKFEIPDSLVRRYALGDETQYLIGSCLFSQYNKRLRHFSRFVVSAGNNGRIGDAWM